MNLILIQKLTMIEKKTYIFPFKQKHNNDIKIKTQLFSFKQKHNN